MKKSNLILTGIALSLVALNGCKKDNIADMVNPSTPGTGADASSERHGQGDNGAVFIMDNAAGGNSVVMYNRNANGQLTPGGTFSTGGTGTGAGLGSQGSIVLDDGYLYACNAGSNEISVLSASASGLTFVDKISSNGTTPISVTTHDHLLYVLNAGGTGNISGFRILPNHHLFHIYNSDKPLSSSAAGPAQIEFNHSGSQLIVTEKATNNILTYDINFLGFPGNAVVHPSVGTTPFGFQFGQNNTVIVSDAFGGVPGASALTSYSLGNNGNLNLVTGPVATTQTAACWVAVTSDGRFCYTTNAGSNNISGYRINNSGALNLIDANGITGVTGAGPNDLSLSRQSEYLYTLNRAGHSISMFRVNNNGGLVSIGDVTGLPDTSVGMAAL